MAEKTPREFAAEVAAAAQRKTGDKRRRVLEELGRRAEVIARRNGFKDPNRFLAQFVPQHPGAATVSEPEPVETFTTGENWTEQALRLCSESGLEPAEVEAFLGGVGSGKDGKILKGDVEGYLELNAEAEP